MNKIATYFNEVKQEFTKVSWPTREELFGSTGVVIILCVLFSCFILGIDTMLGLIINIVFRQGVK